MTDALPHRRKALPFSQSILWAPAVAPRPPETDDYLLFMHQRALNALHDHLRSSPDGGVLGFLLGHLYEDPPSLRKFAVIDLVMRLTIAIYGDKTTVVVSRVWDKMQEELTRSGAQLLGWYHSHPPGGVALAQGDLETHATYFGQPWQSALVIGMGDDGPIGGLYRPRGDGAEAGVALAFYELLDPRSVTPEGKKRSSMRWANYKAHRAPPGVAVARSGPVPAIQAPVSASETVSFKPSAPAAEKPRPAAPPHAVVPLPPPPPAPPPPPPSVPRPPAPLRPLAADMVPPGDTAATPRSGPMPVGHDPVVGQGAPRPQVHRPQPRPGLSRPRQRRSRGGLLLAFLAVVGAGGAAAWYFRLVPWARTQAPAVGLGRDSVTAPAEAAAAGAGADSIAVVASDTVGITPSVAVGPDAGAPVPSIQPPPTSPSSAVVAIDRLSDSLIAAIRSYEERARLYEGGLADCTVLARGLVAVEAVWTTYESEKRRLTTQLDGTRSQRDLLLFSNVDTLSAHYDRSGCRRP